MNQLCIRLNLDLGRTDLEHAFHEWAVFHRWLPNGRHDAVEYLIPSEGAKIEFWFEREGRVQDSFVVFERGRHDVPEDVMDRQATLESGPLYVMLTIDNVPDAVMKAISEERAGDHDYEAFGKIVAKRLLQPPLSKFLGILRCYFGQYWICSVGPWDSRCESLGRYCKRLGLEVSIDGGGSWRQFLPNEPLATPQGIALRFVHPLLFISRGDWETLRKDFAAFAEPSVPVRALNFGHELLDQGHLRAALVEIITALEITADEFIRRSSGAATSTIDAVRTFYDAPLKEKVATLSLALSVDTDDLGSTLRAIQARNALVHESREPPGECEEWLRATLRLCSSFLPNLPLKFPPINTGNQLVGEIDQWERIYARRIH